MRTHNKESQSTMTPSMAMEILKDGNKRFVSNLKFNRNLLQQVNETRDGQWPFATVLSCIDSRTSAELIFDQGLAIYSAYVLPVISLTKTYSAVWSSPVKSQDQNSLSCWDIQNAAP